MRLHQPTSTAGTVPIVGVQLVAAQQAQLHSYELHPREPTHGQHRDTAPARYPVYLQLIVLDQAEEDMIRMMIDVFSS